MARKRVLYIGAMQADADDYGFGTEIGTVFGDGIGKGDQDWLSFVWVEIGDGSSPCSDMYSVSVNLACTLRGCYPLRF